MSLLTRVVWEAPSGSLRTNQGRQIPIVSGGHVRQGYESFADSALVHVKDLDSFRTIVIMSDQLQNVSNIQNAVRSYLGSSHQGELVFENSGLAIVDGMRAGDYAGFARTILLTVIALGSFLTAIVSLTYVLLYRRVLGRRRALGIARIDLGLLTLGRISLPVVIGSVIGGYFADILSHTLYSPVPITFTAAVVIIMVLGPCSAAIAPISWAVNRDPVSILCSA